jgi:hypothetical protein
MTSKQTKEKPSIHDACVREVAEEMKKDKWEVHADLPGFEKPDKIGTFTPTLTATKPGCMKRICEVVTEDMFQGDQQRYLEVKNYCDEYDFRFYVVGKDGKRKEINPATYGKK